MKAFKEHLGEEVSLKAHPYTCFVEFIPTSFNPSFGGIDRVEKNNGLKINSIMDTRWVKNPDRRPPGQQYAHMTVINSRKTTVSKRGPEPIRCLKCQGIGHMAASCPSTQDICSHCAGRHTANNCPHKGDPSKVKCANCLHTDHGAWDRLCPAMVEARKKMIERNPSHNYKYFVTNNPSTWEILSESAPTSRANGNTPPSRPRDNGWKGFHQQGEEDWNIVDRTGSHGKRPPQSSTRRSLSPTPSDNQGDSNTTEATDKRVHFNGPIPTTPPRTSDTAPDATGNTTIFFDTNELPQANDNDSDMHPAFSPRKASKAT